MISEQHEQIATVVAAIYRRVAWKDFTNKKTSAADSLTERIRAASHEPTFSQFLGRLGRYYGVQAPKVTPEQVASLQTPATMGILRKDPMYIALRAQEIAKEQREMEKVEELP